MYRYKGIVPRVIATAGLNQIVNCNYCNLVCLP